MSNKILLVRSKKDGEWRYLVGTPNKFKPKSYPGYMFYKSFSNTKAAETYALQVMHDEALLSARNTEAETLVYE